MTEETEEQLLSRLVCPGLGAAAEAAQEWIERGEGVVADAALVDAADADAEAVGGAGEGRGGAGAKGPGRAMWHLIITSHTSGLSKKDWNPWPPFSLLASSKIASSSSAGTEVVGEMPKACCCCVLCDGN